MRVLYVNSYYEPYVGGGAETTMRLAVEGVASLGHEVMVVSMGPGISPVSDIVNGVPVRRLPIANSYFPLEQKGRSGLQRLTWHLRDSVNEHMADAVEEVLEEFAPTVMVCHNLAGLSAAVWERAKRRRIPLVQVIHDLYLLCCRSTMVRGGRVCDGRCFDCGLLRRSHPKLSADVDGVVGVSAYVLNRMLDAGMFPNARVRKVIYNARPASPALRVRRNDDGEFVFGFIGTLAPHKGIEQLLDAFVAVARPRSRLIIAGSGANDYVSELQQRYGQPNVEFIGHVPSASFYERVDVCAVPSIWPEPLGNVVYESLGAGVPVIAARSGGIPEMIVEGVTGVTYEPLDTPALERLIRGAGVALQFADQEHLRESVQRFFDLERFRAEYEAVLLEVSGAS